jgi:hypothetical protein
VVPAFRLDGLRGDIRGKKINGWQSVHEAYGEFAGHYPLDAACHAWAVLNLVSDCKNAEDFGKELAAIVEIQRRVTGEVYLSRAKDFHDPFRSVTYRNGEEMNEVAGKPESNFFIRLSRENLDNFETAIRALEKRVTNNSEQLLMNNGMTISE